MFAQTMVRLGFVFSLFASSLAMAADEPIAPEKAKEHANKKVTVKMVVKKTKNLIERQSMVYLDSLEDFRSKDNLAITIRKSAIEEMKKAGIDDPAEHYKDKTIQVTGTIKVKEEKARLDVDKADQIVIVTDKPAAVTPPKPAATTPPKPATPAPPKPATPVKPAAK